MHKLNLDSFVIQIDKCECGKLVTGLSQADISNCNINQQVLGNVN